MQSVVFGQKIRENGAADGFNGSKAQLPGELLSLIHIFNPAYMRKNPQEDDILLHYEYNKVMLIKEEDGYRLPAFRDLKGEEDAVESVSYLFSIDSKGYYLADTFQMSEFGGFVMELSLIHI